MSDTNDIVKERMKIAKILDKYKDKDFVQRINYIASGAEDYEWIPGPEGFGKSTHSMASSDRYAYPTVQRNEEGKLQRYGFKNNEAFRRAKETGEIIEFASPEEADWFARNYKALWPENTR